MSTAGRAGPALLEVRGISKAFGHVHSLTDVDFDRLLLALRGAFALLAPDGTVEDLLEVEPDPSVRFNDAKCDPLGRAFAGTMAYDRRPPLAGSLFAVAPGVTGRPAVPWRWR